MEESRAEAEVEDIEKLAEEESVTKLVNQIILEAYKRRATDIHIEPYRGKVRLRYRIDGVLHNAPVPPEMTHFYSSILHISSGPGELNRIVPIVLVGLVVSWIAIYLSIFKGTKVVSKIVKWTVPLPVI